MYCIGCGHLIADSVEACEKCGLSLTAVNAANAPQFVAEPDQNRSRVWVFILILGALFIGAGQVLVTYYDQKSLRETKDETDTANAWFQVGKDILALHLDPGAQSWNAFRTVLLSRESNLTDLNSQNDRIQNRIGLERDQNLGKSDPCERWLLDELGPALKDYAASVNGLFSFVKSTPNLSESDNKTLQMLGSREDDALRNLQHAFSVGKEKGCDK